MLYFVAWLCPPAAMLLCGKPVQAVLNLCLILTCFGLPFAGLWAHWTVREHLADRRTDRLVRAVRRSAAC